MAAIEYQRLILSDRVRTEAFAQALQRAVTPGCTVIDVGAGTGFLSFLARKFGARRCIGIEREEEFYRLSKAIAKSSGISGCTFIHAHSMDIRDLPRSDVVVSETLGNFAYEENILETLRDARRFLKASGTLIPQRILQYVAPVVSQRVWSEIVRWDEIGYGIDWTPARSASVNNMYVKTLRTDELMLPAQCWDTADLLQENLASIRSGQGAWDIKGSLTVYGFCLWWTCTLLPGLDITTGPHAPATHWQQIFLPLARPLLLQEDDTLILRLKSDSRMEVKIRVTWSAEHRRGTTVVSRQDMDMRKGSLLSAHVGRPSARNV